MTNDESLRHRYATPNGSPCPRTLRTDGTVEGSGDCLGCGVCMLFAGLLDLGAQTRSAPPYGTEGPHSTPRTAH
jgi:hypothetical protein